jgi:putative oxidoreductase
MEAAGYDPSGLGFGLKALALFATWMEFLLPLMIVVGLLTRLAALGMIVFVVVQSVTDIVGHGADAETIGGWFDRASDAAIADQRAFWVFLLLFLVIRGPGPFALDRYVLTRVPRPRRAEPEIAREGA